MWLPWQRLVLPKLSHLYAQLHINIIHPCKYEEISLNNSYPHKNFKGFRKMWLPWQCLVLPKLSRLYAQLHINIIHPCKYEEISLNNKGVIRNFSLENCGYHGNALSNPRYLTFMHNCTSISSIHASMKKFH